MGRNDHFDLRGRVLAARFGTCRFGVVGMHADTHCRKARRRPSLVHGSTGDPLPPRVPISPDELEGWLELEVKDLRAQAPHATVRLSRLTQGRPDAHLDIGWLIELELDPTEPLLAGDRLPQALRDMRLLGLQPTLLTPTTSTPHTNGQAA